MNNSFIFELVEEYGGDGYLVFFGTLELMADEFDIFNPGVVTLSIKKLTKNLQLSRQKTVRILRFCHEKATKDPTKKTAFFVDINKNHVTLNCKRLAELCDEHTRKLLKKNPELLQSEIGVTPVQEVEEEVEVYKDKIPSASSDAGQIENSYLTRKKKKLNGQKLTWFLEFWKVFNYGKGKAEAADVWLQIPKLNDTLFQSILNGARQEAYRRSELIAQEKTPKMAQGWLSGKRWEDEVDAGPGQESDAYKQYLKSKEQNETFET